MSIPTNLLNTNETFRPMISPRSGKVFAHLLVTDQGRLYNTNTERFTRPVPNGGGRRYSGYNVPYEGVINAARLVYWAFNGSEGKTLPTFLNVDHKDNNPKNDNLENLNVLTKSQNLRKDQRARLTPDQVDAVKILLNSEMSEEEVAAATGIPWQTITRMNQNLCYADKPEPTKAEAEGVTDPAIMKEMEEQEALHDRIRNEREEEYRDIIDASKAKMTPEDRDHAVFLYDEVLKIGEQMVDNCVVRKAWYYDRAFGWEQLSTSIPMYESRIRHKIVDFRDEETGHGLVLEIDTDSLKMLEKSWPADDMTDCPFIYAAALIIFRRTMESFPEAYDLPWDVVKKENEAYLAHRLLAAEVAVKVYK